MAAMQYNKNAVTKVALYAVVGLMAFGLHGCDHEATKSYINRAKSDALAWRDEHFSNCTDASGCMQQFKTASQQAAAAVAEQAKVHAEAAQVAMQNNGHLNWTMQQAVAASDQAAAVAQQAASNAQAAAQNTVTAGQAHASTLQQSVGDVHAQVSAQASQYGAQAQQYGAQAHQQASQYASQAGAAIQSYITPAPPATNAQAGAAVPPLVMPAPPATAAPVVPPAEYVTPAPSVPIATFAPTVTFPPPAEYWFALPKVAGEGESGSVVVRALPSVIGSSALVGVAAMALVAFRRHVIAAAVASDGGDETLVSRV
eukprot:CAMPEP_0117601848 /NCGR_PEP_ID=MMETSP0784-20121206/77253_1 /TAXON_ID=39447 /ORGANISM="" /LENGTH=313 /DNA_ID=CAMNT_0005404601 /DNA_START=21 /DNA_END=959 /DNA_ORIENTATION=+